MKKVFFILFLISVTFLFSCKKYRTEILSNNESTNYYPQDQPAKIYALHSCVYESGGVNYSACECLPSAFKQCLKGTDCYPINYNGSWLPIEEAFPISWGFTDEEENGWRNGENVIEVDDTFIDNHYNFFIQMYEAGITLHPDSLKCNN